MFVSIACCQGLKSRFVKDIESLEANVASLGCQISELHLCVGLSIESYLS